MPLGSPERTQLDSEPNYIEHDLRQDFPSDFPREVDGILLSHVIEHLDAQESTLAVWRCRELLKDGGIMRISVPDADYFYGMIERDENSPEAVRRLFDPGFGSHVGYVEYALFYVEHKQVFDFRTLLLQLAVAGFDVKKEVFRVGHRTTHFNNEASQALAAIDNRDKFSVFIEARNLKGYPTAGQKWFNRYRAEVLKSGGDQRVPMPPIEVFM